MALKTPKNIIVTSKYTQGNEYMYANTQESYQGYYYELNGKTFVGKTFDVYSLELVRMTPNNFNTLLTKASTYVYGAISGIKLKNTKPQSYIFQPTEEEVLNSSSTRYFSKQLNETPVIIKEINKSNYDELLQNPLYKTVSIKYINTNKNTGDLDPVELSKAIIQIPELNIFLADEIQSGKRPGQDFLEDIPYIQNFT